MRTCTVTFESISPYSQSRQHHTEKLPKETNDAYEQRTWREKCTTDDEGQICIPAMAFKQCLDATAKKFSTQIPGKGKATYTKHFLSGVMVDNDVPLGIKKDEVSSVTINANADGVRGSGKRVQRTFPVIQSWKAPVRFIVLDETITNDVFEKYLTEAGYFTGIGRFRPENGGLNGRFKPVRFEWN